MISSCTTYGKDVNYQYQGENSEIVCPFSGQRVMVYGVAPDDIYRAVQKHIKAQIKKHTADSYTILKFENGSTALIRGVRPEDLKKCQIRKVPVGRAKSYVVH